eukprot:16361710-Heterocapsa_arctica.AAC.1
MVSTNHEIIDMINLLDNTDSVINADTGDYDERASSSHENMNISANIIEPVINADAVSHISENGEEENEMDFGQ